MKRNISVILALVMLIMAMPFVSYAQNYDKELEEAILKSKRLFGITDEYDQFNYSLSTYNDETNFHLYWHDSKNALGDISVIITSDGFVKSFYKWDISSQRNRSKLPNLSKGEGFTIAEKFIEKVSPELKGKIKYNENQGPLYVHSDTYDYSFIRMENNIPYYSNSLQVYVDNYTGEVIGYYVNWEKDLKFTSADGIISLDKANSLYKEKIGLELIYKAKYDSDTMEYYLVYSPLNTNLSIDAKTGEVVSYYNNYGIVEETVGDAVAKESENLSPAEERAVDSIKGIITRAEAEKIAGHILEIEDKYNLNYITLFKNRDREDSYYWYLDFVKKDDSSYGSASISINAVTKEIISFNKYEPVSEDISPKYNKDESLKIAEKLIERLAKDKKKYIELKENLEVIRPLGEEKSYSFQFVRKIDKAYVQDNGIYVTVDAVSGMVTSYNLSWNEVDFPAQDNVIALEKAYDVLFEEVGLELKYIVPNRYDLDISSRKNQEAILVYGLKNHKHANIDANTGVILDYNGKVYEEPNVITYKDLDSSYARDKIVTLAQFGIALPGEEFKPKDKMVQRDFLYLLAKVDYSYIDIEDDDRLYEIMINRGIIKEEERAPERYITKEEAIKYVIKALNYDKIADLTHIFKDVFKDSEDISDELKGYVAIAYGLKIVEGSNGYLNPKGELKREDGANIIYNYLSII